MSSFRFPVALGLFVTSLFLLVISIPAGAQYRGQLSSNPYDPNSTSNPYGRYGSPYSPDSVNNPYVPRGPLDLYDQSGQYRGCANCSQYDPNSISNPYGRYGSPYSPESVNNPYGAGSPYRPDSPTNPYGRGWRIIEEE
jgi:hypothetical protein